MKIFRDNRFKDELTDVDNREYYFLNCVLMFILK